jgi:hypothetical protein
MAIMADIEYLSTRQAALFDWASPSALSRTWWKVARCEAWKTAGGHRRIPVAAVEALLARAVNRFTQCPGQLAASLTS